MMKCKYYQKCGACLYDLGDYAASIKDKKAKLKRMFKEDFAFYAMDDPYHSRHKVTFSFYKDKGIIKSGLYAQYSRKVIAIKDCPLQSKTANALIASIDELANAFKLSVFNPLSKKGLLRHVQIRVASDDQKALLTFVLGEKIFPSSRNFIKELTKRHKEINGIVFNYNFRQTAVVLGESDKVVYGKDSLEDKMGDLTFMISSRSFYQVNPKVAYKIYSDIVEDGNLSLDDKVLDAYTGTGTIASFIAKEVKEVIGIDNNPASIKNARLNAFKNNIKNSRFIVGDALKALSDDYDAIIVDPPRSGLHEAFIKELIKRRPKKIIYVSCDPATFKRDLSKLKRYYRIIKLKFYDQFVFSEHVEGLAILQCLDKGL